MNANKEQRYDERISRGRRCTAGHVNSGTVFSTDDILHATYGGGLTSEAARFVVALAEIDGGPGGPGYAWETKGRFERGSVKRKGKRKVRL